MPRWLLVLAAVAALGFGGLQALAAGGVMTQADVLGVSSTHNADAGSASEQGLAHKKDKTKTDQDAAVNQQDGEDEGACAANADSHGCAVSKAVHEALDGTPPGPERGVAVSTAARTADCSMLPQGAQDACAKRAEKEHPRAGAIATQNTGKGKGKK